MADTQLNISYHSITDKGGRAVNEDSLGILPTKDALYFLLCDGLGGHGSGDIASSFVVEQMKANLEKGISVEESITRTQQALLEKQKKGKKRMKQIGNVEVPQKAFLAVLKLD